MNTAQLTDKQIIACNGDSDEPIISAPDADLIAFARAVLSSRDAEVQRLREALLKLDEACDDSDEARYGTLSTSFVRNTARAALKEQA